MEKQKAQMRVEERDKRFEALQNQMMNAAEEIEEAEEETREGMYRSELTNEWIDESLKNQRPIAVLVDNEKNRLSMAFNENNVELTCVNQNGTANDNIEIEYQGENFVIAFNYKYITEALKNSEVENIQIKVGNPEMPILFDLGFTGVIAPLKI